jgi:hypothetical protein
MQIKTAVKNRRTLLKKCAGQEHLLINIQDMAYIDEYSQLKPEC